MSDHIGLRGSGFDDELAIAKESDRAYLLEAEDGTRFWMPKSAFSDDGALYLWALAMLEEKMEKGGQT